MTNVPDPRSDLQWGLWEGAIHEVFHRNAQRLPERPCVIETSPRREFTYRQIDGASNVLAHYFVSSGIDRGDVIMIYAFRNVDLVVAIMATLKAGATFSVIDPAYPPDRQIIYLDVARPKALINIGKAKGGKLSDRVSEWIDNNLKLKAFVPSLQLHDDARLVGGVIDGKDVLTESQTKSASLPDVIVGPDSCPTLSFTSGSEGKPKGVLGRHFSLVHYFPWMAKRFGLSQEDRFTMLSGISHDPIQRDIFTPLFLGARIMVPSPEDIQHEKLAEWMREHRTTVTHLTPAMGQILVGGASAQFPDLRNAFFVGDVLIKRDVRRLQELAPNVQTINMFGTTETQRAVSYFAIPSRVKDPDFLDRLGDRVPAGQGMNNVQLLVVDRENRQRICDVGEQGEIYVRAAGLAEGYLGLEDITKEKFVQSWFVPKDHWSKQETNDKAPWRAFYKGARDRLYRSGDLGHYTESGDVECTGRIDSQIKIRGFRIELGEIDTHLSHHPMVRENITICRNQKGENVLHSYIVIEKSRQKDWLDEQNASLSGQDVSEHELVRSSLKNLLRSKIPPYAVPSAIVILDRMPLNPNGKIDRPALPLPTSRDQSITVSQRSGAETADRTPTETELAQVWSSLLDDVPADAIGPENSLGDFGGHSLVFTRLPSAVRRKFPIKDIPLQSIYDHPRLRDYAAEIDRLLSGSSAKVNSEQTAFYSEDAKTTANTIPKSIPTAQSKTTADHSVLLTGATGFLGAFLLANLLSRQNVAKVFAHVRAKTSEAATQRVRQTCIAYGIWESTWEARLECVAGDLEQPHLGVRDQIWHRLIEEVDIVIANGAKVHWIDPYTKLRASNVAPLTTIFELCASSHPSMKTRPKRVCFVSSTSALDTPHYVSLSESISKTAEFEGVPESDDLSGAQKGLSTGYGQSKWVGEYLMREAGRRGLSGVIVRPGYVLGDSEQGTSITDDYLIRLLKGCDQVKSYPDISALINTVPVDTVAAITIAAALHPGTSSHSPTDTSNATSGVTTCNITSHPRRPLSFLLSALGSAGYDVTPLPFLEWRQKMEAALSSDQTPSQLQHGESSQSKKEENALAPLAHLVLGDLPTSTIAPALDDRNAMAALRADLGDEKAGAMQLGIDEQALRRYLGYLVGVGFMRAPPSEGVDGKRLEVAVLGEEQKKALRALSGRGAVA